MGVVSEVKMYDFLIRPIRERDLQEGNEFVKRLLQGSQSVWETIQTKIDSVKDLWSVTDCPDAYLKYLKQIVGWTPDLHGITDRLSNATLRRLIAASVPLWKSRTTEDAIVDILGLLVPGRSRVWNWFDFRWVLDETIFSVEHQGRDPWLISLPGAPELPEYWSNVRIVDPSAADRTLLKDTLNLMRPAGERYEIIYLKFLDMFNVDGDVSQWDVTEGTGDPAVKDGIASLTDDTEIQSVAANPSGSSAWQDYVVSTRVRRPLVGAHTTGYFGIALAFDPVLGNGYRIRVDTYFNQLALQKVTGWSPTTIASFDFSTVPQNIYPNVWYGLRVQATPEGATTRFKVYFDGVLRINTTDSTHPGVGTVGFYHVTNAKIDCDEIEVMGLPIDKETVEINY